MNTKPLVLVTGAGGYIAAHVVKVLLDNGYQVRGTLRNVRDERKVAPLKQLSTRDDRNLQLVEADLLKPETWPKAIEGCQYVLHTASPFITVEPKNPDDLIKPAVDGTLNVLRACAADGRVKRVVVTSSVAAVIGDMNKQTTYDENDWTDVNSKVSTYMKSKTLAEKAAWDFVKETNKFELAVVNPGFVIGPLLHNSDCASASVIKMMLEHEAPMLPKLMMHPIDVRDVAIGHLKAMTLPEAAGNRHLLTSTSVWMKDMACTLSKEFGPQGYSIPTSESPRIFLQIFSLWDKNAAAVVPDYGKVTTMENNRMVRVLGIQPIDVNKSVIDMAYSLIDRGLVKKTAKYKPRPADVVPQTHM